MLRIDGNTLSLSNQTAEELASKVDAVIVASPSDCHLAGVRAAVQADFCHDRLCLLADYFT